MVKKSVLLHFGASLVDKPVISGLIRDYDVSVNILHARVTPEEAGTMFVHIEGVEAKVSRALDYLNQIIQSQDRQQIYCPEFCIKPEPQKKSCAYPLQ